MKCHICGSEPPCKHYEITPAQLLGYIYPNGGGNPAAIEFHEDPGHGWLQVPMDMIHKLGIASKITGYSYQDKTNVYLEEDCDLTTLFQALGISFMDESTEEGRKRADLRQYFWRNCPQNHTSGTSPIRSKKSYKYEPINNTIQTKLL